MNPTKEYRAAMAQLRLDRARHKELRERFEREIKASEEQVYAAEKAVRTAFYEAAADHVRIGDVVELACRIGSGRYYATRGQKGDLCIVVSVQFGICTESPDRPDKPTLMVKRQKGGDRFTVEPRQYKLLPKPAAAPTHDRHTHPALPAPDGAQ